MSVVNDVIDSIREVLGKTEEEERTWSVSDCTHATLAPRWDDIHQMGRDDLISRYECTTCGAAFSPDRAEEIQQERIERLREAV